MPEIFSCVCPNDLDAPPLAGSSFVIPPHLLVAPGDLVVSEEQLGIGALGTVYRAALRGRPVCVKVRGGVGWGSGVGGVFLH